MCVYIYIYVHVYIERGAYICIISVKACTETCMAQSLRQAHDYWQDQPGLFITTGLNTGVTPVL